MLLLTHKPPYTETLLEHLLGCEYPFDGAGFLYNDWDATTFDRPRWLDYAMLGAGHFSSVWGIPDQPDKVLKVSHRESDACRHYLRWCVDHPSPHAPKIHHHYYHEHMMVIVMDRLYPLYTDLWGVTRDMVPGYAVLCEDDEPNPDCSFEQFCGKVKRNFADYRFDIHGHNVMKDGDGTLVLTDPVSYDTYTCT